MRIWRLVPLLVLVLLLPFACSNSDNPIDPGGESGVLKGRVVDSSGGEALGGVIVRLEGTDQTAVTAADGSFEFTGLAGGVFTVVVEPPDSAPYQSNRFEISVRSGDTVTVDCTVLPEDATPGSITIYPSSSRVGVLESVQFYIGGGGWIGSDGRETVPYRPTWSIRSEHAIGVVSREGIFIGTAVGSGQIVASLSEGVNAVADIEVVADGDVARIILYPPYLMEVPAGGSRYLAAYAINGAGDVASGASLVWSVDPATLGTIEPVTDLTPEERAEILARLWYGWNGGWGEPTEPGPDGTWPSGDDSTITVPGDSGIAVPPGPIPPDVDPSAITLVRFTAETVVQGDARGAIRVGAEGASWTEAVGISVFSRGTLTTAHLYPEEVRLTPGSEAFLFAYGLNQWDRPIGGLAYAWSVEPASLGALEELEGPWVSPNDPPIRDGSIEPGSDGPFPDRRGGALFRAAAVGDGTVRCVVTDSITGASIEKLARVRVAPAAVLDRIVVRPHPIEGTVGDSLYVEAAALSTWNEVDWSAKIVWSFEGNCGVFVALDGRGGADGDATGGPGEPGWPDDPTYPPVPGGSYGMGYGYFLANGPGGMGTLTATAASESGDVVRIEVPVRIVAR